MKQLIQKFLALFLFLALSACGEHRQHGDPSQAHFPSKATGAQVESMGTIPSSAMQHILGHFNTTLESEYWFFDEVQPATIQLSTTVHDGFQYGYITILSNGSLGNLNFNAHAIQLLNGGFQNMGNITYVLESEMLDPASDSQLYNISSEPFVIRLYFTFSGNGSTLIPSQSMARIMDCGVSPTCDTLLLERQFGDSMSKN